MISLSDIQALKDYWKVNRHETLFPLAGPLRRELYVAHREFFSKGLDYRVRLFMAGNRTGKSVAGAYETMLHATGLYPSWWTGRRFTKPIKAWVIGLTAKTTRDSVQVELCGEHNERGTGLIPLRLLPFEHITTKAGVPNAIDTCYVTHVSGGMSKIVFKSNDQGREAFQAESLDWIWMDEEVGEDIYEECLMRTMTTKGCAIMTFTPLNGLTELVAKFMPEGSEMDSIDNGYEANHSWITVCGWNDVPHLDKETIEEMYNKLPPHQRDSRSRGIPKLGSGAIYPIQEERFVCDDFEIPKHWKKAYGLDVGWNTTAGVFGAVDAASGVLYIYSCHYAGNAIPDVHAAAIKARGYYPGVIDPASRGRSQVDGSQLIMEYGRCGLDLSAADNSVEAGIYKVWQMLVNGTLKVFRSCRPILDEYRIYRRDDKGKIVKAKDHAMDAMRYLVMSGLELARTDVVADLTSWQPLASNPNSWMA